MRLQIVGIVLMASVAAAGGFAGTATADPLDSANEALFESYCGGCHALGASDPGRSAPDLTQLHEKYGEPLPQGRLVDFVTTRRRPGAQRICNEHAWSNLHPVPFRDHMEQVTVRAALAFVATRQRSD